MYNAATHIAQFWDGRAETVEEQAKGPILNPIEMANDEKRIVETLSSIPQYVEAFRRGLPPAAKPITLDNVADAIGAFERGLVTRSRWDKFIAGNSGALSAAEKRGLRTFLEVGCMACHTGPQVGGSMFQRVGVMEPWPNQADVGRAAITKARADKMMFKVPSLKNIAETGPVLPRRLGEDAGSRDSHHGSLPGGRVAHRTGHPRHRHLDASLSGRRPATSPCPSCLRGPNARRSPFWTDLLETSPRNASKFTIASSA